VLHEPPEQPLQLALLVIDRPSLEALNRDSFLLIE